MRLLRVWCGCGVWCVCCWAAQAVTKFNRLMAAGSGKKPGACILFIYLLFIFYLLSPHGCWGRKQTWCFYFSVCMPCTCICICICICVYMMLPGAAKATGLHICIYVACVYVSVYLCVYAYVYVCHTYLYISANDCVHGHMCVCIYKRKSATVIITVFMLPLLLPLSLPPLASG